MIDTRPNLDDSKFEQCSGDQLSLSGTSDFYGSLNIKSGTTLNIANDAASGKVLTSDASGNATWQTLSITPSAIGPDKSIQFNNDGALSGCSCFCFDSFSRVFLYESIWSSYNDNPYIGSIGKGSVSDSAADFCVVGGGGGSLGGCGGSICIKPGISYAQPAANTIICGGSVSATLAGNVCIIGGQISQQVHDALGRTSCGGHVYIHGGRAFSTCTGGHVYISGGTSTGGTKGNVYLVDLPAQTSETCAVYIDSNGKLSVGVVGAGDALTGATNGLETSGDDVCLGGTLTKDTCINTADAYGLAIGSGATATGNNSLAIGQYTCASGDESFVGGQGYDGGYSIYCVYATAPASFAFQKSGTGASQGVSGEGSAILGGTQHCIDAACSAILGGTSHCVRSIESAIIGGGNNEICSGNDCAVILGGDGILVDTGDGLGNHAIVPSLAIWDTPADDSDGDVLVWDSATKKVGKTTISSIGGVTGGTNGLSTSGADIILGGTLTGDTAICGDSGTYSLSLGEGGDGLNNFCVDAQSVEISSANDISLIGDVKIPLTTSCSSTHKSLYVNPSNGLVTTGDSVCFIDWSGSTANAIGTYVDANTICAESNLTFDLVASQPTLTISGTSSNRALLQYCVGTSVAKLGFVDGAPDQFTLWDSSDNPMFNIYPIGATELYYNKNKKLETTTGGIDITGKVVTDTLQVQTGAAAGCVLTSDASGNATWQSPSGGGIGWSGSTANGIGTYADVNGVCAEPNFKIDGTSLCANGNILFCQGSTRIICVAEATDGGNGDDLYVCAGGGDCDSTPGVGGLIGIEGGYGGSNTLSGSDGANGGNVEICGGFGGLYGGGLGNGGVGGNLCLCGGYGGGGYYGGDGGDVKICAGGGYSSYGGGDGGDVCINAGVAGTGFAVGDGAEGHICLGTNMCICENVDPTIKLEGSRLVLEGDTTSNRDAIFWTHGTTTIWGNYLESTGDLCTKRNSGSGDYCVEVGSSSLIVGNSTSYFCSAGSLYFYAGGNLQQYLTSSTVYLRYNGSTKLCTLNNGVCVTGCGFATDWIASSDLRLKDNVVPITSALSKLNELCGVCYDFCEDGTPDMGLIAQDVEKVEPRLVTTNEPNKTEKEKYGINDQTYGLKYDKFAGLFVEAIKELKEQNNCLQIQINALRKKLNS